MGIEESYPIVETGTSSSREDNAATAEPAVRGSRWGFIQSMLLWDLAVLLCVLHGWAIWTSLGGREGLTNGWPIARDDHPLYYHSALVTRTFLKETAMTAGYDPAFMAGYPKSIVFPSSSTLPELVVYFFGGDRPEFAYKAYVFVGVAALPWLILASACLLRANAGGALLGVGLYLIYFWIDWPVYYAMFGMVPYLVAVPLGLVAMASIAAYVGRGGFLRWLVAALMGALCVLVHFTTAMVVAPAALACYVVGIIRQRQQEEGFPVSRHVGVALLPLAVLALNAFWWLPGIYLAATKGDSSFSFAHAESVKHRLLQVMVTESAIQCVLIGLGLVGLAATVRRTPIAGVGLTVFAAMGFFWGYLAGAFRSLDFLQPGRHTYVFYTGLAVACGLGWSEISRRLRAIRGRLDIWATLAIVLIGCRFYAVLIDTAFAVYLGRPRMVLEDEFPEARQLVLFTPKPEPFLSSRPSLPLLWVLERVKRHVRPGERLLYEEAGKSLAEPNPVGVGRFSGLLPDSCGIEVIGGPYLHASLTTNFTQFGEGKLFGDPNWGREQFVKYAKLYRPSAILCWSTRARSFCRDNPDLVEIKEEEGGLMIGRIKGFGGWTIRGEAEVKATPNHLVVSKIKPGLDGLAVLRYHSVPCLRSSPEGRWEPVLVEGDPVPFIGVRPGSEPVELELAVPLPWMRRKP
jgi:hypothetical protein